MSVVCYEGSEVLAAHGLVWPEPYEGRPFTRCVKLTRESRYDDVYFLPPTYPSNRIETDWELNEDGYNYAVAWRECTPEEWAERLDAYGKAKAEWSRTNGHYRVKAGPDIVIGTFEGDGGLRAEGVYGNGAWHWRDVSWREPPRPID